MTYVDVFIQFEQSSYTEGPEGGGGGGVGSHFPVPFRFFSKFPFTFQT